MKMRTARQGGVASRRHAEESASGAADTSSGPARDLRGRRRGTAADAAGKPEAVAAGLRKKPGEAVSPALEAEVDEAKAGTKTDEDEDVALPDGLEEILSLLKSQREEESAAQKEEAAARAREETAKQEEDNLEALFGGVRESAVPSGLANAVEDVWSATKGTRTSSDEAEDSQDVHAATEVGEARANGEESNSEMELNGEDDSLRAEGVDGSLSGGDTDAFSGEKNVVEPLINGGSDPEVTRGGAGTAVGVAITEVEEINGEPSPKEAEGSLGAPTEDDSLRSGDTHVKDRDDVVQPTMNGNSIPEATRHVDGGETGSNAAQARDGGATSESHETDAVEAEMHESRTHAVAVAEGNQGRADGSGELGDDSVLHEAENGDQAKGGGPDVEVQEVREGFGETQAANHQDNHDSWRTDSDAIIETNGGNAEAQADSDKSKGMEESVEEADVGVGGAQAETTAASDATAIGDDPSEAKGMDESSLMASTVGTRKGIEVNDEDVEKRLEAILEKIRVDSASAEPEQRTFTAMETDSGSRNVQEAAAEMEGALDDSKQSRTSQ